MIKAFFLLLVGGVLFTNSLNAQNGIHVTPLNIGDQMPNLVLDQIGEVVYNKTGSKKFSDFKGKLVILDFWNIHCGSCIEGFPKMEKLQKKFKDSIQIIFVNAEQNKAEIVKYLGKNMQGERFPFEVLQIDNAKILAKLFPFFYSGTQVWIDPKGIVRIVGGSSMNNHEVKIREVLAGKGITYVSLGKHENYSHNIPQFSSLYNSKTGFVPLIQSAIFPYNEEIGCSGSENRDIIDPTRNNKTSRYANYGLLALYNQVYSKDFSASWENEIFTPYDGCPYLNKYVLEVKDTLRYTDYFSQRRDIDWVKSQYCYEQFVPASLSEKESNQYMLEDLNRYFGNLFGTTAKIEQQILPCFLLVKTSSFNPEQIKAPKKRFTWRKYEEGGKKMIQATGELSSLLQGYAAILFKITKKKPFLDETNFTDYVNLTLPDPNEIENIEELRASLQPYGLDIITENRNLDMLVIKDTKEKIIN
ncbi:MAG: TlpA disulfide reductase family protein [Bacteroidota bacterium]